VLDFLEINSVGFAVKGVQVVGLSPSCWIFRSFLAFPLQRPKKSKLLGLRVAGVAGVARNPSKSGNPCEALTVTVEEKMEQLGELKVVLP